MKSLGPAAPAAPAAPAMPAPSIASAVPEPEPRGGSVGALLALVIAMCSLVFLARVGCLHTPYARDSYVSHVTTQPWPPPPTAADLELERASQELQQALEDVRRATESLPMPSEP